MIFSRIYQIIIGVLSIACITFFIQLKILKYENDSLKSNTLRLGDSIIAQDSTIDYLRESSSQLNKNIYILTKSYDESSNQLNLSIKEINNLRETEAKRAINNPYERGNFATDMLSKRLQSITRKTNPDTNKTTPTEASITPKG